MRFLLVACLLTGLAGAALAEGEYQNTKNGRTMVWNSRPKPGDVATWNGGRDGERYADGFGTLTWYTTKGDAKPVVYGVYYGNMRRGKFEGPVNVHVKGKTAHAEFTDGTRTSRWVSGPTANWKAEEKMAVAKKAPAEIRENIEREARDIDRPKPVDVAEKRPAAEPTPRVEPKRTEPVRRETVEPEPSIPPVVAEKRVEAVQSSPETPEPPAEKPMPTAAPVRRKIAQIPAANPAKQKAKFDDSLRSLVGPPSTLRAGSIQDAPPSEMAAPAPVEASKSEPAEPAVKRSSANLTESEVINLAYTEALSQGYNLGRYEAPKLDYSKAKNRWSVLYQAKSSDNPEETAKSLVIAVEDDTKKASVAPR